MRLVCCVVLLSSRPMYPPPLVLVAPAPPPFSFSRCQAMCLAKQSLPYTVVWLQNQNCFCAVLVGCVHTLQT